MTDPIADLLTRIRNGQSSNKASVNVPASTKKKGSPSPNRPKSGNKAEAFPLKKRREYIRAMENIADRLYFSNKLKREKERSLE